MKQTLTIAWRAFVVASALAVSVVIEASAQSTTVSSGPRLDQDHARLAVLRNGRRYVDSANGHPANIGDFNGRYELSQLRQSARVEGGRDQVHA